MPFDENDEHEYENCGAIWETHEMDDVVDDETWSGTCRECGCACRPVEGE